MSNLIVSLECLKPVQNGESVAKRMFQLLDLALEPQNIYLAPSIKMVIKTIVAHEEKLLKRSRLEMSREGNILNYLYQAMLESTEEEWADAKNKLDVKPLGRTDTERLMADASGLVRDTGFTEWVLGETEINPRDVEGLVNRTRIIREG